MTETAYEFPHTPELDDAGEVIDKRPYMDPLTGDRYESPGVATGHPERPHPPVQVVKVSGFDKWAKGEAADEGDDAGEAPTPKPKRKTASSRSRKRKTASSRKT